MKCSDGTLRNQAMNQCFSTQNTNGTGNVYSGNCVYFPEIPDYQKWDFVFKKNFTDGQIEQDVYQIKNH